MTRNTQPGTDLCYELTGEGPTLVLAHAGIADLRMWDEQTAAFAAHYRVLRYDLRGFGRSPSAGESFSHLQDLLGLLDHLGVAGAHFVGLSNGSSVVTDFALEHPERVLSLVLASPAVSGYEFSSELPPELLELLGALGAGDLDRAAELAAQIWVDGPSRPPERVDAGMRAKVEAMSRAALKTMLPDAVQPDGLEPPALGRLGEISAPTLVILGDQDDSSILDIGAALVAGVRRAEKVVVPGAAHMVNMERPEAFNRAVLNFLERAGRG